MSFGFGFALPRLRPLASAAAWAPAELFGASEPGIAYDLTDSSKLYQDSGRTTLISANGDPIGSVTDLSGNAKHASQATTASKPLYQGYADFDGVDDSWATAAIDFTGTDAVTVVVALRIPALASSSVPLELSSTISSNNGAFGLLLSSPSSFQALSKGTALSNASTVLTLPRTLVYSQRADISADENVLWIDGAPVVAPTTDQGTGSYGNYVFYVGRRGGSSVPFVGRIYRMIVIGRTLTADELAQAEAWCAEPAGVVLA